MIPAAFDYVRPSTLDDAIRELAAHDGETKIIAGGQSILPLLKLRLAAVGRLVDIGRLAELRGVRTMADGSLAVGALTTYAELMDSPVMNLACMADALPNVGDVQVRNRGTLGGAIAHADPASDMPAVLLALEAICIARGSGGERSIPLTQLFTGPFETSLGEHEIVTEIRLPAPSGSYGSAYVSLEQPASGYSLVGVAAVVGRRSGGRGAIDDVRIGITGVGPVAYRAGAVEAALAAGATPADAARHAVDGVEVSSDIHADREYRSSMAVVYTRRAIEKALARAG